MDTRTKIIRRTLTIDLLDSTVIEFSKEDLEWIGEQIEYVLQQRFVVKVDLISCETRTNLYQEDK